MARNVQKEAHIAGLIHRITTSRHEVEDQVKAVKVRFDVAARLKEAVKSKPGLFAGGAVAVGFLARKLFSRPVKEEHHKPKTLIGILLGLLIGFAKPAIRSLVLSEFQRRIKTHHFWGNPSSETQLPLSKYQAPPSN